jgi:histone H3/H4
MARIKQARPKLVVQKSKHKGGATKSTVRFSETRVKKDGTPARMPRARPGMAALREIRMYQGGIVRSSKKPKGKDPATALLMPKASMERLVREVLQDTDVLDGATVQRFQGDALVAIHTAAEAYLTDLWTTGQIIACYTKRQSVRFTDLLLAKYFEDTPMPARNARSIPISMPRPNSDRSGGVTVVVPPKKKPLVYNKEPTKPSKKDKLEAQEKQRQKIKRERKAAKAAAKAAAAADAAEAGPAMSVGGDDQSAALMDHEGYDDSEADNGVHVDESYEGEGVTA